MTLESSPSAKPVTDTMMSWQRRMTFWELEKEQSARGVMGMTKHQKDIGLHG